MSYKLRNAEISDYQEVTMMYKELVKIIYSTRKIGEDYFFYRTVMGWVQAGKDIVVCEKDGELCGFTLGYIDDMGGITETIYNAEVAYVKPKYRKTRVAYMLYTNVANYVDEMGLALQSCAFIGNNENKVDQIQQKLGCVPTFIQMERS